jgi:hypothetical protein
MRPVGALSSPRPQADNSIQVTQAIAVFHRHTSYFTQCGLLALTAFARWSRRLRKARLQGFGNPQHCQGRDDIEVRSGTIRYG